MSRPSYSRGDLSRACPQVATGSSSDGGDHGDTASPNSSTIASAECAARPMRNPARYPSRSTASSYSASLSNSYPELPHKGYCAIYHPRDPNGPNPDVDCDCDSETYHQAEQEAKLASEVVSLSSGESFAGSSFSSDASGDSRDSKDSDKPVKENGFDVIKTRDLSPRSKQMRRENNAERKALNKGMDDLRKSFKPSYTTAFGTATGTRDHPVVHREGRS